MHYLFQSLQHLFKIDCGVDTLNLGDALARVALLNTDMNNTLSETSGNHLVILSIVKARLLSG